MLPDMTRLARTTGVLAVLVCVLRAGGGENWAQFRGAGSQGRSDSRRLPVQFGEQQNVRWKTAIHDRAWSSPVVWGKQIWLTTATKQGTDLYAMCIDRESGQVLQDLKLFLVPNPQYAHPFNTYASPTPVIEEGRIYVTFGSPGTACLDTASGKVLWSRTDLVCNHFRGAGSSPILFENLLIMHFDGSDLQYVIALDKNTGKTAWKTDRSVDFKDLTPEGKPQTDGDFRKAFSTPVIANVGGRPVMISLGSKACYAYDPRMGKELWRVEYRECHSGSPTPVLGDGVVYVCMGLARGELWAMRIAPEIAPGARILWKVTRNVPTRSSPILVDGLLYMVDDGGIASCIDPASGGEVWHGRLKGAHSASPIYADGKLYFFGEGGHVAVIQPGRQFRQLAENRLDDGFMASAAVAGNALFLRTRTNLYRIENEP